MTVPHGNSAAGELLHISPDAMRPYPGLNPRKRFDPEKHQELVVSLKEHGNFQPLLVTPAPMSGAFAEKGIEYHVCAGERRWRAAVDAGVDLLCLVRPLTYEQAIELAGLENLQRDDLTAIEEARWMQKMLELPDMTQVQLAERLGRAPSTVANALRLLRLPAEVLDLVEDGIIGSTQARDYLVPFAEIRIDRIRKAFFADIATALREANEEREGSIPGVEIREVVGSVASDHGKPIAQSRGYYGHQDKPLFDADLHKACTCGGPAFAYNRWNEEKEVLCFDPQWWEKANKDAQKEIDRQRAAAEKKIKAQAEKVAGQEIVTAKQVEQLYPSYRDKVEIARRGPGKKATFAHGVLIDPSRLPEDSLLVVAGRYGGGLELICTKVGSVNAAKGQLTKEKKKLADELRANQRVRDLAAAERAKIEPWMLLLLAQEADSSSYNTSRLAQAALDLELIQPGQYGRTSLKGAKLADDQVETLVKVFAIRHKRGDFAGHKETFEARAEAQLTTKYEAMLQDLLPEPAPAKPKKKAPSKKRTRKKAAANV